MGSILTVKNNFKKQNKMKTQKEQIEKRLEYLRKELRAERISYDELFELQNLISFIEPNDTELLEAAGVFEFE